MRMPAETSPHEGTLMVWPARASLWGELLDEAEHDHAVIARSIAAFEPVTMVARPEAAERAASRCGPTVQVVELPVDDSWARDSGPIYVRHEAGQRLALDWRFNSWGEKYLPYDDDDRLPERWADLHGDPRVAVPM